MVGSKQNLLKADAKNTAVQIGNNYIICVDTVCDLGFIVDNELKYTAHINKLSSTIISVWMKFSLVCLYRWVLL